MKYDGTLALFKKKPEKIISGTRKGPLMLSATSMLGEQADINPPSSQTK
jgi:hypothetical protein